MAQRKFEKATKSKAAVAAGAEFYKNYIQFISKNVVLEYGKSYQYSDTLRHSWRSKIPHTAQVADFLILHTKTYIRIQGSRNLEFLEKFAELVAGYLSTFFNKIPGYGTQKEEFNKLMATFYWDFSYVKSIKEQNAAKFNKPLKVNKPSKFTNGKTTVPTSLEKFNKTKGKISAGDRNKNRYSR